MNSQNLQFYSTAYPNRTGDAALLPPNNRQLVIHSFMATNNSGSTCDVGLGVRYADSAWHAYTFSGVTATDVTTNLQAGALSNIFTTTTNDGFIIQGKGKFNGLTFDLAQAQGGAPVYAYEYWNGTAWISLTPLFSGFTGSRGYVSFLTPIDWVEGNGGLTPNLSIVSQGYSLRVRATTAGSQAVRATKLYLTYFMVYQRNVQPDQYMNIKFSDAPLVLEASQALVPYFSVPSANNLVTISYKVIQ